MKLTDQKLRGRTVIAADGLSIGELVKLFIDSEGWRLQAVEVKLHKDVADRIGAGRRLFHAGTMEIPTHLIQSVGDAVVLSVPTDELSRLLPAGQESAPVQ